jgi:hypothetical protein
MEDDDDAREGIGAPYFFVVGSLVSSALDIVVGVVAGDSI